MFHAFYAQPLGAVGLEILLTVALWAIMSATWGKSKPKLWKIGNLALLAVSVLLILYATLMRRTAAARELILLPGNFVLEAQRQPEVYRSLLMNVYLFVPFGLTLSAAQSAVGRMPWKSVLLTVLCAAALSCAVETAQYLGGFGRAETDDLLANALGAFLGALHVPLGAMIAKRIHDVSDADTPDADAQ